MMFTSDETFYAILAGLSASASSLFIKLTGIQDSLTSFSIIMKFIFFSLMVVCNAAVWTFFVKALQASKSSLPATVTSAATNYFCSAVIGFLLFGEVTSVLWWIGTLLVLMGLVLICRSQTDSSQHQKVA